jgi:hypothetical protein
MTHWKLGTLWALVVALDIMALASGDAVFIAAGILGCMIAVAHT